MPLKFPSKRTTDRLAYGLLIFLCLFVGLAGLRNVWIGLISPSWPRAQGLVIAADVRRRGVRAQRNYAYEQYAYNVGGVPYDGSRVSTDLFFVDYRAVLSRYRVNQPVQVYYNPNNPRDALLEPGSLEGIWLVGGAILLYGLVLKRLWRYVR